MNPMLELARSEGHRSRMPRTSDGALKPPCELEMRVIDFVSHNPKSSVRQIRIGLSMAAADAKRLANKARIRGSLTMSKQPGHGGEWKRYSLKVNQ